jgi:hypothetical protein
VSENITRRVEELTKALQAAQLEKSEAYIASDWNRVSELTSHDIPKLEQEIAALTGTEDLSKNPSPADITEQFEISLLNFDQLSIELIDVKNSLFNSVIRRQARTINKVKISLVFSEQQAPIVHHSLLDRVIFYETRGDKGITASDLIKGPWISEPMAEWDANRTAENARQGINDLRLIIQERARKHSS